MRQDGSSINYRARGKHAHVRTLSHLEAHMFNRKKLARSHSKAIFKKGAQRIHKKNLPSTIMRGGIRL